MQMGLLGKGDNTDFLSSEIASEMVLSYPFEYIQVPWPELIMQMEGKEPFP